MHGACSNPEQEEKRGDPSRSSTWGGGILNETPQHTILFADSFNGESPSFYPLLAWLQKRTQVNGNTYAKEDSAVGVSHSWTGREDLSCGYTSRVVQEQWKAVKSANLIIRQIIRIVLVVRKYGGIGSYDLTSGAPKSG